MSSLRKHSRLLVVAVVCVALGGASASASAIATAGAASNSPAKAAAKGHAKLGRRGGLRRFATRAVDGSVVIRTKAGFKTVTFERGKVDSVSGQQLTITEGRYHQVRRMFAAVGNHVLALHRDRIGGLDLPEDLAPGDLRLMSERELDALFARA